MFQVKQIRFALGNKFATLEELENFAAENNIRPAKVVRACNKTVDPLDDNVSMNADTPM
jgi:hypothetical protein